MIPNPLRAWAFSVWRCTAANWQGASLALSEMSVLVAHPGRCPSSRDCGSQTSNSRRHLAASRASPEPPWHQGCEPCTAVSVILGPTWGTCASLPAVRPPQPQPTSGANYPLARVPSSNLTRPRGVFTHTSAVGGCLLAAMCASGWDWPPAAVGGAACYTQQSRGHLSFCICGPRFAVHSAEGTLLL